MGWLGVRWWWGKNNMLDYLRLSDGPQTTNVTEFELLTLHKS